VTLTELDLHINDAEFARAAASRLIALMQSHAAAKKSSL
jgi:hypothetical protein